MPSFINKQTTLDLNGPILSFVQNPSSVSCCSSGIVTFVGVATATFPTQDPPNPASNTGYISYKWYLDGYGELNDGEFNGTTVAGSATTTLTLSNISDVVLFNNSKFFLRADYIPSAYAVPGNDVTAGTARSTGNAVNDPKDSEIAELTVFTDIIITKQPEISGLATTETQVQYTNDYLNNTVLRLPLYDKGTGSLVLEDLSVVKNNVTNTNVTWNSSGGKFYNGYAKFNALSYIDVTPASDFDFGTGDFTIEAWCYFTQLGFNDIFSTGTYGQNQLTIRKNSYSQLPSSPGSEQLEVYYNTTIIASGGSISLNRWVHCAVLRKDGVLKLFLDGIEIASANFANNIDANPVRIGAAFGNPYHMIGGIQDLEVYNVAKYPGTFTPLPVSTTKVNLSPSVAQNSVATFTVEASTVDSSQGDVSYQWQLNEVDLVDGEVTASIPKNNTDFPSNSVLRLPLWDKKTGSLVLEDLTNVPNTSVNTNVNWVSGGGKFYNGHANFGNNSFITLSPLSDFNFGTGDFTVETWVYFTELGFNDIFSTGNYGQNQLSIRKNASSQLSQSPGSEQLEVYYNATIIASGGKFNLNTWHHVAVTRTTPLTTLKQDSTLRLFVDGVQVASTVFNENIKATDVKIGRTPNNVYNMIGRMQDFQVHAVSKYTSNFTPSTVAIVDNRLVLSLPLWDNGTGTLALTDLSSNTKSITPGRAWGSSPSWKPGVGKFYGGAAYFGGSSYLNVAGSSDFNFGTQDFTIECWVNFQNGANSYPTGPWEVLICVGGGYYSDGGTWFAFLRSGAGATFYLADTAGYTSIGTVSDLKVGTWRHLAVSKDSSQVRFYVDGQLILAKSLIYNWSTQLFGGNNDGYIALEHATFHTQGYYFPFCYMQDIKIYKGVAVYTQNFTPDQTSIVTGLSETVDVSTFVSGAQTSTLSIALPNVSKNLLRAKITHPTACNSPVYTNTSQFNVVPPTSRGVIEVEAYDSTSTTAILREFDLTDLDYIITSDVLNSDTICFYAKDRDLVVEMDMYGAKGDDSPYTKTFVEPGGEGGYSKIRFTMKKGEEYILRGIKSKTALYLYRKAQLIACVGQGGSGTLGGAGGKGGGVNVAGENGYGKNPGVGGASILSGQMTGNGIFGSSSTATQIYSEDSKATGTNGGRTISCTKGVYWREQRKTACEDLGISKFRLPDGREVENSALINRGFKDGYSINQTAGAGAVISGSVNGGKGGNGATGGSGGVVGGGGGGSGYTDTSVTVVQTSLGGNSSKQTKAVLRLYEVLSSQDFYVDSVGRILILSCATPGKDPRTLTKTTGKVLPGTDTCIDDTRWQNFIELAKTQDYRLTATTDGGGPVTRAQPFNIRRMINANSIPLKRSLTDWENTNYAYLLLALAWDETNISGARGYGLDYSILSNAPGSYYFGYYGESSNAFFDESRGVYGYTTANWWILPPGVPDFP